jgi:hypothetical protein
VNNFSEIPLIFPPLEPSPITVTANREPPIYRTTDHRHQEPPTPTAPPAREYLGITPQVASNTQRTTRS